MSHITRAQALRDCPDRHYNCAQSVLLPFAAEADLDPETACRLSDHFGAGMRRGAACGAVTGGLMALGLLGCTGEDTAKAFQREFETKATALDCAALLHSAEERGQPQKINCDGLVQLAVELTEEFLERAGQIKRAKK